MSGRNVARRVAATGAAVLLAIAGASFATAPPAGAASPAKLSVVHAVPDLTVDVWVDGKRTVDNFKPGSVAGPLSLPAGSYEVAITKSDAKNDNDPAIGPVTLELAAGGNYSAVAHLKPNGDPTASLFVNDVSRTAPGQGRLTVRHTAAAPAVDVLASGKAVVSGLTNPKQAVLNLPAGTVKASVAAAGTTKPVIGPANVAVKEGTNTVVYAWGSLEDGNLAFATQQFGGLQNAPGGVPAGEAGLADTTSAPWLLVGGAAAAGGVLLLASRRRRVSVRS